MFESLKNAFHGAVNYGKKRYQEKAQLIRNWLEQQSARKAHMKMVEDAKYRQEKLIWQRKQEAKDTEKAEKKGAWRAMPFGEKAKVYGQHIKAGAKVAATGVAIVGHGISNASDSALKGINAVGNRPVVNPGIAKKRISSSNVSSPKVRRIKVKIKKILSHNGKRYKYVAKFSDIRLAMQRGNKLKEQGRQVLHKDIVVNNKSYLAVYATVAKRKAVTA